MSTTPKRTMLRYIHTEVTTNRWAWEEYNPAERVWTMHRTDNEGRGEYMWDETAKTWIRLNTELDLTRRSKSSIYSILRRKWMREWRKYIK